MRIATFQHAGRRQLGEISADGHSLRAFTQLDSSRGALPLIELAAAGQPLPSADGPQLELASVRLEAPLPQPRRNLWCVGRNYHAHARELRETVFSTSPVRTDEWPIVFSKVPETVVGPADLVRLPGEAVSAQIDYEAELAVVIGRGGRNITRAEALSHVFGWTIVNDITARDVQMRHQQWDLGKSFDTFCPMGPWIVTADALDATDTRLRCWVNDELRQDARTSDLIFDIPTLIETISRGITLLPGDVIATGTPAGVGMGSNPPRWLQPGDEMRITIDGIGTLVNRCAHYE